jgi:hypothetical protein
MTTAIAAPEYEAVALAAVTAHPELLDRLDPTLFYLDDSQTYLSLVRDLFASGVRPELTTLIEAAQTRKILSATKIFDIASAEFIRANFDHYVGTLRQLAQRRRTLDATRGLLDRLQRNGEDPGGALADFWEKIGTPQSGQATEAFEALPAPEFLAASFAGAVRLVPSVGLTEAGVGLLSGPGGTGKSLLGMNLGAAWAGALLPIGEAIPAARPLRVLMVQVEDSPGMVQERLRKILGGAAAPPGLIVSTRKEPMRFSEARGKPILAALDRLQATLRQHAPIDVAIFDPLVYLHEAEENSSSEMSRWLVPLRDACRECGTAPFLVHHAGWVSEGEDARGRGSTAIRAWADLELGLHATTKNGRTLHRLNLVKTNFAERWKDPLTLELDERTLRFDVVDEAGTLCPPEDLVAWLEEDHGGIWKEPRADLYAAIEKHFGCSERTAKDALSRAKATGRLKDHGQRKPLEVVAYSRELLP